MYKSWDIFSGLNFKFIFFFLNESYSFKILKVLNSYLPIGRHYEVLSHAILSFYIDIIGIIKEKLLYL